MAKLVSIDEIEGGQMSENLEGFLSTRVATIENVEGNADQKQFNALNADGVPLIGDSHPTIPGATVASRSVVAFGKAQFKVFLQYSSVKGFFPTVLGGRPDVTVDTSMQEIVVRTHQHDGKDHLAGEPLLVIYTDKSRTIIVDALGVPINGDKERTREYSATATILVPLTKVGFRRRTKEKPLTESLDFAGKINAQDFLVVGDTNAWLCTNISAISQDGGDTWITNYIFLLNRRGINFNWDEPIIFLDDETGQIPNETVYTLGEGVTRLFVGFTVTTNGKQLIQETNGVVGFTPYASADFAKLDLVTIGDLGNFDG